MNICLSPKFKSIKIICLSLILNSFISFCCFSWVTILGETKQLINKTDHIAYYSRMGNFYYVNGFLNDAADSYSSSICITPYQKEIYPVLGNIYEKLNNSKNAIKFYRMGANLYPEDEQNLLFLGIYYQRRQKFNTAYKIFKKILLNNPKSINAITCMSECLIELGQPSKALDILNKALVKFPDNFILQHNTGWAWEQLNNTENAILHLEKAIHINPNFYLSRILLGNIYYSLGNQSKAAENFKEALKIDPDNQEIHILLGELYFSLNNFTEASKSLKNAVALGEVTPKILIGLAWALFASDQIEESKKYLNIIMKKNKKKFDANELNDLGWLLCRLEKYEKGITFLEKALKIKPNMKKALNNLFFIQNKLKNYSETLKIAKKLSLLEPDSAEALNTLGWLQFKNNKINEAIKSFIKTTELAPDFSLAFNNLGLMFYLKNNLQSSYEWYEKASKINSSSESRAYAFNNMGLIDFKQKKFKKAEENFTKAIEIKSNYIPALNNLGILYNTLEKDNLAEKIYTRVLNYEQGTGEAHVAALQLGLLKIKNNQLEQAHILLQRVYEEAEKTISFKAGILLASIYIKQKKYTKAINTYNSILEKNINNSEIYLNIGNLYFKMKDFDNAKRSFEKSIEIDNLNINALNSLAYLLACQNIQLDKALIYSKKALNIANKNNESPDIIGSFSDTLGWIYFQKGDLKKSLHFLNEALLCFKNKKGSEEVLYHKALTLMKKGDIEKAFECLKKAITISPESEYGKKCQILLDMEQKSKK